MRSLCRFVVLLLCSVPGCAQSHSYLFVWAGDDAKKSNDFLAVIDADSKSPHYGEAVASVAVPGPSGTPHHTELEMPEGGFLLANAFESGRTILFDLRDPLHPSLVTSFGDLDGYMHPHTYVRLANGPVLATFQYHGGHEPNSDGGGLVEFDERGHLIRSSSAMDAAAKGELIRPYSLVVVPALDRIVSTNTAMHEKDGDSRTVQVWRLSDLELLRTLVLPPGPRGSEQKFPGEPHVLADGKTVLVHTFSCGLYEMEGTDGGHPSVRHLKTFDGEQCDVPLRIGHYWVQTLSSVHALATYDISDLAHIREVSRLTFDEKQKPHWIAADADGRRMVLNSGEYGDHRLFMVNFDPQTGAMKLDERFRDPGSDRPGVSMDGKSWPHGFHGDAYPHGTVFSLPVPAPHANTQKATGTIVLYRPRGKNFGLIHYSEGVHPTVYCDDIRIARMRESRRTSVTADAGQHTCVALEKQYPGELNADSEKVSIQARAGTVTYLRLECPFGHVHFVLREMPVDAGAAESAKMLPIKDRDSYTTILGTKTSRGASP